MSKTVGTPTAEVLYTFDDANPIDPLSLASLIQVHIIAQPPSPPLPWSFCAAQACGSRPALKPWLHLQSRVEAAHLQNRELQCTEVL